jgi:hypothetical protein
MSIPADLERQVRQLDNDVSSIYELLTDVDTGVRKVRAAQLRQGSRLDQIEDRLTGIDGKLDLVLAVLNRNPPNVSEYPESLAWRRDFRLASTRGARAAAARVVIVRSGGAATLPAVSPDHGT